MNGVPSSQASAICLDIAFFVASREGGRPTERNSLVTTASAPMPREPIATHDCSREPVEEELQLFQHAPAALEGNVHALDARVCKTGDGLSGWTPVPPDCRTRS
ncbi:hypothetical protein BH09GEM1_BH09GEM1_33530 [soil metagenome]